ncbi:MAG: phosphoribosylformylglycinamidine synthase subunit PurL [Elusimicrobiota bacterium]
MKTAAPPPPVKTVAASPWEEPWLTAPLAKLTAADARCGWSLNAEELKTIQAHFRTLDREPTHAEIETIAQTWSEHCKHKTFTSPICYQEGRSKKRYKSLLDETIKAATKRLNRSWCLSVFSDNAGVVQFDKKWALAYKVETHNHPCAIEPYGGAETGVGGVIRDILGVGLGAKPILNTDIFCFAPPDYKGTLPNGTLHPRRTMKGVVSGVRDYGNRMGIPTASGAIWFDEAYRFNPLIFVGTVGLMPIGAVKKRVAPGDIILAVGGRTGRDGIHGATFSSADLNGSEGASVVQIGHAINEKRMLDALLRARDLKLYRALTDCGAGGFSSAIGELAVDAGARGGANVQLKGSLLKAADLDPWEIWISESQERMVLAVPPKNLKAIQDLFATEGVETCALGAFANTGRLTVRHDGETLVDLDLRFLHNGLPRRERSAVWNPPAKNGAVKRGGREDVRRQIPDILRWMLAHPNVCSREWVIRQYDHEVLAGTVVKPLHGLHHDGPGDASVFWPTAVTGETKSYRGLAVSHGINPNYGKIDPHAMALLAVDEALGNLVCVGADVSRASMLDNFCWGNPDDPQTLGALVRAAQGCHDASIGYGVPFISGKDSLNNEYTDPKGVRHAIPGTLLISALAPVPDIRKAVTMDFKNPGNPIYLVGATRDELGASLYAEWSGKHEGRLPAVDCKCARATLAAVQNASAKGVVRSAHNLSEGGLAVALSEMAFSGDIGAQIDLDRMLRAKEICDEATLLFSESPSRFLLEIDADKEKTIAKLFRGVPLARIGATIANPVLRIVSLDGRLLMEEGVRELKAAWKETLPTMLDGRKR